MDHGGKRDLGGRVDEVSVGEEDVVQEAVDFGSKHLRGLVQGLATGLDVNEDALHGSEKDGLK